MKSNVNLFTTILILATALSFSFTACVGLNKNQPSPYIEIDSTTAACLSPKDFKRLSRLTHALDKTIFSTLKPELVKEGSCIGLYYYIPGIQTVPSHALVFYPVLFFENNLFISTIRNIKGNQRIAEEFATKSLGLFTKEELNKIKFIYS
ncbi:MAG: hypothetical protein AAFP92_32650, partial [Bacteroidota bacterium]